MPDRIAAMSILDSRARLSPMETFQQKQFNLKLSKMADKKHVASRRHFSLAYEKSSKAILPLIPGQSYQQDSSKWVTFDMQKKRAMAKKVDKRREAAWQAQETMQPSVSRAAKQFNSGQRQAYTLNERKKSIFLSPQKQKTNTFVKPRVAQRTLNETANPSSTIKFKAQKKSPKGKLNLNGIADYSQLLPKNTRFGQRASSIDLVGQMDNSMDVTLPDLNVSHLELALARDDSVQRFNVNTELDNDSPKNQEFSLVQVPIAEQLAESVAESRQQESIGLGQTDQAFNTIAGSSLFERSQQVQKSPDRVPMKAVKEKLISKNLYNTRLSNTVDRKDKAKRTIEVEKPTTVIARKVRLKNFSTNERPMPVTTQKQSQSRLNSQPPLEIARHFILTSDEQTT